MEGSTVIPEQGCDFTEAADIELEHGKEGFGRRVSGRDGAGGGLQRLVCGHSAL